MERWRLAAQPARQQQAGQVPGDVVAQLVGVDGADQALGWRPSPQVLDHGEDRLDELQGADHRARCSLVVPGLDRGDQRLQIGDQARQRREARQIVRVEQFLDLAPPEVAEEHPERSRVGETHAEWQQQIEDEPAEVLHHSGTHFGGG